jgi:mannitol/fructose-specific phosphotransferase system IIA component
MQIYICDQDEVNNNFCNSTEIGEFIVTPNNTELAKNLIFTTAIHLKDPGQPIHYDIKNTGYYCVTTSAFTSGQTYSAILEFRNAYGELPAAQIAKLPFYGGITIAYAVIGA